MNLRTGFFFGLAVVAGVAMSGGGCSASDNPSSGTGKVSSGNTGGSNTGSGGSGSTGGSASTGGSGNTGGSASTGGSGNTGGSVSTGGTGNTGGSENTGGSSESTGGSDGSGGSSTSGGDAGSCVDQVKASGTYTDACATCLCNNCADQLAAINNDPDARAVVDCYVEKQCSGSCCFCNDTHPCSMSCTNYPSAQKPGPCSAVTEKAAGKPTPSNCYTDGMAVTQACLATANTSCGHATAMGDCNKNKCAAECAQLPACQ